MDIVLFNEKMINKIQAFTSIEDRGYQFGDGIYEVIRVYNGKPFTAKEHLDRLERSAREILLDIKKEREILEGNLESLIKKNNLKTGIIYIQISRGTAPRAHDFPENGTNPQLVAYTREMGRPVNKQKTGVGVGLIEDIRWLRCDIKSLNLLGNVLAKQKAKTNGHYEAIQHRDQLVTEGSHSNVFMVKNGQIYTHPISNYILSGITRSIIIKISEQINIPVREEALTVEQLLAADEVFITSTTIEVMPVIQIDNQNIGTGKPGPVATRLLEQFISLIN